MGVRSAGERQTVSGLGRGDGGAPSQKKTLVVPAGSLSLYSSVPSRMHSSVRRTATACTCESKPLALPMCFRRSTVSVCFLKLVSVHVRVIGPLSSSVQIDSCSLPVFLRYSLMRQHRS